VRYRQVDSSGIWSDGGSRIGLTWHWRINPDIGLFARAEAGINILDQIDFLFNRGDRPAGQDFGDTFFRRLLNVGVETPRAVLTVGKAWSTYYRVSSFTDRFQGTGASASGTYNAGTDGGSTGTGRADDVLQGRGFAGPLQRELLLRPLGLNVQLQHGEPIPLVEGKRYNTTVGLSTVYETESSLAIGVAYNHANIDDADLEALRSVGIDGDATALVVGARWYGDKWYVGTVVSRLKNHDTTDDGIYFDGTGWEVYSQYNVLGPWWAVAGWNILEPDSSQAQAGAFEVDYGVVGVRYSFQGFRKMIFANVRLESSVSQDGSPRSDVYTIGIRWDLP
jgi:predicted porin